MSDYKDIKNIPQSQLEHLVQSSLLSFIDTQVCVHSLDNSLFVGEMSAFDQTNAITLVSARQRWYCNKKFHEEPVGTIYIAGMNVCMIASRDDTYLNDCEEVSLEQILKEIEESKVKTKEASLQLE